MRTKLLTNKSKDQFIVSQGQRYWEYFLAIDASFHWAASWAGMNYENVPEVVLHFFGNGSVSLLVKIFKNK